jgi:hypothetical protein
MNKLIDSDGYELVPSTFTKRDYTYSFVENIDKDWSVYSVFSPAAKKVIDYELVKFTKNEERTVFGSTIPKKWSYPNDESFGTTGFSCHSLRGCHSKYKLLMQKAEGQATSSAANALPIEIPFDEEFSVSTLMSKLNQPYHRIYLKIKSLGDEIELVREVPSPSGKGKPTKIFRRKKSNPAA